jgi:hypothetical protein
MMTEVLGLAGSALGIWESKEKRKYSDKLIKLDKEMREALSERPMDNARLDNIYADIKVYIEALARDIKNG